MTEGLALVIRTTAINESSAPTLIFPTTSDEWGASFITFFHKEQ